MFKLITLVAIVSVFGVLAWVTASDWQEAEASVVLQKSEWRCVKVEGVVCVEYVRTGED